MSVGAAGCGYEDRNVGGLCGCYHEVDNKPHCLKHHTDRRKANVTVLSMMCF